MYFLGPIGLSVIAGCACMHILSRSIGTLPEKIVPQTIEIQGGTLPKISIPLTSISPGRLEVVVVSPAQRSEKGVKRSAKE